MAKQKINYWSIYPILSKKAQYNVIYGERSNGKTYGTLEYCLTEYFANESEFAYVRRWDEDIAGMKGASLFNSLIKNGVIRKLSRGKWNNVTYKSRAYYFSFNDDDGNIVTDIKPFAYAFALTQHEHYKSNSYPNIRNIVFDEFLTRGIYLPNEFILWQNVISTLVRERDDVKIFMLGNTVNKYSPYIAEMGLTRMRTQKQDTIDIYEYGQSGLRVAVEYSVMKSEKKSNKYFAFDNPRLQMITSGKWEIDIYPHYPSDDYSSPIPKEILYIFYIEFEGSLLQCEIINKTKNKAGEDKPCIFLFIHPKTTPLKEDNINLVYSQTPNPKPNYRRTITRATNNLERKIQQFFARDKVFYSDNETGEIMRNYLAWCKS